MLAHIYEGAATKVFICPVYSLKVPDKKALSAYGLERPGEANVQSGLLWTNGSA